MRNRLPELATVSIVRMPKREWIFLAKNALDFVQLPSAGCVNSDGFAQLLAADRAFSREPVPLRARLLEKDGVDPARAKGQQHRAHDDDRGFHGATMP